MATKKKSQKQESNEIKEQQKESFTSQKEVSKNDEKDNTTVCVAKPNEPNYPSELLAKSESFKQFRLHPDIIRAILTKQSYTISEAKSLVQNYLDSFRV